MSRRPVASARFIPSQRGSVVQKPTPVRESHGKVHEVQGCHSSGCPFPKKGCFTACKLRRIAIRQRIGARPSAANAMVWARQVVAECGDHAAVPSQRMGSFVIHVMALRAGSTKRIGRRRPICDRDRDRLLRIEGEPFPPGGRVHRRFDQPVQMAEPADAPSDEPQGRFLEPVDGKPPPGRPSRAGRQQRRRLRLADPARHPRGPTAR